jgi:uncharacterized RmlC-like cupin family protein
VWVCASATTFKATNVGMQAVTCNRSGTGECRRTLTVQSFVRNHFQTRKVERWLVESGKAGTRVGMLLDVRLEAGDSMYIPRGYLHEGEMIANASKPSIHLTSTLHSMRMSDLLLSVRLLFLCF